MADAVPLARHVIVGDEARSGEVRVAGVAHGLFVPQFPGGGSALLAVSIVGAPVMPHVIYLPSSRPNKPIVGARPAARRTIFRFEIVDITLAMGIAGVVNLAMLATAAAVFHSHGLPGAGDDLSQVAGGLNRYLGAHSGLFFGIALLASGIASSCVGTMSGQVAALAKTCSLRSASVAFAGTSAHKSCW